jgi:ribokinase/sulfofructose kinase
MTATIDLLAIGNPCVDLVIHAARVPSWDDKCIGQAGGIFSGGTEANVACAASRLGLSTAVFGQVGEDAHAEFLIEDLKRFGVDVSMVAKREDAASATTVILVSPQGERAIVWVPMPARERSALRAALAMSRIAYTMPYDANDLEELSALAVAAGAQVVIDVEREGASGAGALPRLLQHCDIAFMNESGFTTAMGQPPTLEGLRALRDIGKAHTVVVTMGARGALAVSGQVSAVHAAFWAPVVDTTGAGDTFNAAFLAGRAAGVDLRQSLAWGCAAASKTIASVGARTGMPCLEQIKAMLSGATHVD